MTQVGLPQSVAAGLDGIDISNCQPPVDWAKVAAAGKRFVWCKLGGGPSPAHNTGLYVDNMFARHTQGARAAGLRVGAYFFGKPVGDPILQARFFVRNYVWKPGDLPPLLDLEVMDDLTPAQVVGWAMAFFTEADHMMGVSLAFYTYTSFLQQLAPHASDWWSDRVICQAQYDGLAKAVAPFPAPRFLQYDGNEGVCPGVTGACDEDRFLGTADELAALCGDPNDPYDDVA